MRLLILACFLFLSACGAEHPFQRGNDYNPFEGNNKSSDPSAPTEPNDPQLSEQYFNLRLMPLIQSDCSMCHAPIGFERAKELVIIGSPESSTLYLKATGTGHPAKWSRNSDEAKTLAEWIDGV